MGMIQFNNRHVGEKVVFFRDGKANVGHITRKYNSVAVIKLISGEEIQANLRKLRTCKI